MMKNSMELSLSANTILGSMLLAAINNYEKELKEMKAMTELCSLSFIKEVLPEKLRKKTEAYAERLVEIEEKLRNMKAAESEFIEKIPNFKRVYECGIELQKLDEAYKKADKFSPEEKEALIEMVEYAEENAEYVETSGDVRKDYEAYLKAYEKHNAGK